MPELASLPPTLYTATSVAITAHRTWRNDRHNEPANRSGQMRRPAPNARHAPAQNAVYFTAKEVDLDQRGIPIKTSDSSVLENFPNFFIDNAFASAILVVVRCVS
jgi:hypothetical protein